MYAISSLHARLTEFAMLSGAQEVLQPLVTLCNAPPMPQPPGYLFSDPFVTAMTCMYGVLPFTKRLELLSVIPQHPVLSRPRFYVHKKNRSGDTVGLDSIVAYGIYVEMKTEVKYARLESANSVNNLMSVYNIAMGESTVDPQLTNVYFTMVSALRSSLSEKRNPLGYVSVRASHGENLSSTVVRADRSVTGVLSCRLLQATTHQRQGA